MIVRPDLLNALQYLDGNALPLEPGQKAADGLLLSGSCVENRGNRRTLVSAQHGEDRLLLSAGARLARRGRVARRAGRTHGPLGGYQDLAQGC